MKNLENQSANGSIFEVYLETFLLRIVGKPGFPQKSNWGRDLPQETKI